MLDLDQKDQRMEENPSPSEPGRGGLRVTSLVKRFGDFTAVNDVSFDLAPGTFYALLGPSGCGKTTLLKMLAGLERQTSGKIHLGGQDISDLPPYERPLNTVFQQYALFPHMNAQRNVAYALQQKRPRPSRQDISKQVDQMLELVQMGALRNRKPWELSGGQQQRIALARALIAHPQVLLLDESLSALDAKLRREMQGELKSLQERLGISFIFVTHDQGEALYMADRIAVMRGGRIVQDATPAELYHRPADTWVGSFIGSINYIPGQVKQESGRQATLATNLGDMPGVKVGESLAVGDPATLGVRPENTVLMRDPDIRQNLQNLDATITTIDFRGDHTDCAVRLDTGETFRVRHNQSSAVDTKALKKGDRVRIGWDTNDAKIIPRWETTQKIEEDS